MVSRILSWVQKNCISLFVFPSFSGLNPSEEEVMSVCNQVWDDSGGGFIGFLVFCDFYPRKNYLACIC